MAALLKLNAPLRAKNSLEAENIALPSSPEEARDYI